MEQQAQASSNEDRTVRKGVRVMLLLAGASAVALALPAVARAQATTATSTETNSTAEDIVVIAPGFVPEGSATATKTDIPLIETPQSISVITRDQIDLLNFVDGQQAVRYTAGVQGENYGPDLRFDFITVRGFTPKQYIDGLAAPISTSIFSVGVDLYAFQSLDILKGPASVLYGNAPPGGIYNQTSRRPSSEFGGEVAVKYGTQDYKQIASFVTGPVNDWIDASATILYRDRGADRDFVGARRLTVAPAATFKLGERGKLTALGYYQYDEVDGDTNGFLPVLGTLEANPLGQIDRGTNLGEPDYNRYRRRQFGLGYDFVFELTDTINFNSNTKWSDYDEDSKNIYGAGLAADNRTVFRFNFPYSEQVQSFATDNRLDARFVTGDLEQKLLVGVDYRNVRNFARFGFGPASSIDLFNPIYNAAPIVEPPLGISFGFPVAPFNNQRLRQTGIYAQDQLKLGGIIVTLGGRYDWVNIENRNNATEVKQEKFTYRAGLSYLTEAGIAPYVSYAKSFEPALGVDTVTGVAFDPSEGEQIEAGVKFDGRAFGDDVKLFATAAVFKIKQSNILTSTGSFPPVVSQTGEVEVSGAEVEIVTRIRDQLSINASYSYTDSEVTRSAFAAAVGAALPTTPKHKASFFADYSFTGQTLNGFGIGAGVRYTSRSAGVLPGPFDSVIYLGEDPVLFDAVIRYDTEGWRFAVNASNLLDERYVARAASASNANFGASRQVIGTITRKF